MSKENKVEDELNTPKITGDNYDYELANKEFSSTDKEDQDKGDLDEGEQVSEAEQLARNSGWLPQKEYEGDQEKWVDAREFNFRGELMGRISNQGKQISTYAKEIGDLKTSLQALGNHNKKIAEIERGKAIESLKQQKAVALSADDHEAVVELDDKIQDIKADIIEEPEEESTSNQKAPHPAFVAWVGRPENKWYTQDRMLHGFANVYAQEYAAQNGAANDPDNFDVAGMMEHISTQITKQFPERFGKPRTNRSPAANEPANNGRTTHRNKNKFTEKDLDDMQRDIGRSFVKAEAFSNIQEYVDQLAALGELPTQRGV